MAFKDVTDAEIASRRVVSAWWFVSLPSGDNDLVMMLALISSKLRVCIISIVRAIYIGRVSITDGSCTHFLSKFSALAKVLILQNSGVDTNGGLWSVAETCVAVVSACLPTFRPLFSKAVQSRNVTAVPERSLPSSQRSHNKYGIKMATFSSSWTGDKSRSTQRDDTGSFTRLADVKDLESR